MKQYVREQITLYHYVHTEAITCGEGPQAETLAAPGFYSENHTQHNDSYLWEPLM